MTRGKFCEKEIYKRGDRNIIALILAIISNVALEIIMP
jgi:hypothetical protein